MASDKPSVGPQLIRGMTQFRDDLKAARRDELVKELAEIEAEIAQSGAATKAQAGWYEILTAQLAAMDAKEPPCNPSSPGCCSSAESRSGSTSSTSSTAATPTSEAPPRDEAVKPDGGRGTLRDEIKAQGPCHVCGGPRPLGDYCRCRPIPSTPPDAGEVGGSRVRDIRLHCPQCQRITTWIPHAINVVNGRAWCGQCMYEPNATSSIEEVTALREALRLLGAEVGLWRQNYNRHQRGVTNFYAPMPTATDANALARGAVEGGKP